MFERIDSKIIAKNIKCLRIGANLTQEQMAEQLGYSLRQYRRLESNGTYTLGRLNLIAYTFNVSVWGILKKDAF